MRVALVLGVFACAGLPPQPNTPLSSTVLTDPVALATWFRGSVGDGGLTFADPSCRQDFPSPVQVPADRLHRFAQCVSQLGLVPGQREDAIADVKVMHDAAGLEIEVRVVQEHDGPRISWIGYASQADGELVVPTITSEALEALRTGGERDGGIDPATAAGFEVDSLEGKTAYAWIKVCLDGDGNVISTRSYQTSSGKAAQVFGAAASMWTFKPFVLGGHATPVCSLARMAYPSGAALGAEVLPMPPPPPRAGRKKPVLQLGSSKLIEGRRIAGTRNIRPDRLTQETLMRRHTTTELVGSFRICLDETGQVESVLPMKSTGFASYDRAIIAGIHEWRYSPYTVDGEPIAICTAATFIFSQRWL